MADEELYASPQESNTSKAGLDDGQQHTQTAPSTTQSKAVSRSGGGKKKGCLDGDGEPSLGQCIIGEFVGTLLLVWFGCASCMNNLHTVNFDADKVVHDYTGHYYNPNAGFKPVPAVTQASTQLQIALAFGIAVATIAQAIGHVSGCHLNPAVTFGLLVAGEIKLKKALIYVGVQCGAATIAAALLIIPNFAFMVYEDSTKEIDTSVLHGKSLKMEKVHVKPPVDIPLCCSSVAFDPLTVVAALLNEFFIVFMLVLTVCGVCDNLRNDVKGSAPLAIGLAVFLGHIVGIRYSGASMNPARSFGPLLVALPMDFTGAKQALLSHFVYWVGPVGGGCAAGAIYRYVFKIKPKDSY